MDLKSYLIHNHVLSLCFDTFSVAQRQGTSVPDACRLTRLFFMLKALVPNWQKGSMSYQNNRIMWMNGWHYVFVTSESSLSIRDTWTKRNMHPCQSLSKIFSINSWILNFVLGISNLKIHICTAMLDWSKHFSRVLPSDHNFYPQETQHRNIHDHTQT